MLQLKVSRSETTLVDLSETVVVYLCFIVFVVFRDLFKYLLIILFFP